MLACGVVRATVTIDPGLMRELEALAQRERLSLEQVVDRTLRLGLTGSAKPSHCRRYRTRTFALGTPRVPSLEKALAVASALEDEPVARKLAPLEP